MTLTAERILQLFESLNTELSREGVRGELYLAGGARDAEAAEAILARYYPLDRYPAKTRYVIEELLAD